MPNWNAMQEKAIFTHDKNILVSASAGSGKTTVLIARLLHLIQDKKIEINRILAMTFTEAAANEMKKRMAKELTNALEMCEDSDEQDYLKKQLANLSSSYISTIHGFCLAIIQNYYYIIGLQKERVENIIDDAASASLIERSIDQTFQHYLSYDEFLYLRTIFSARANNDDALKESILSLFNLANAKSDPIAFLASCKQGKEIQSFQDYEDDILEYFFDALRVQNESILNISECFEEYAIIADETKHIEGIKQKISFLKQAQHCLEIKNYAQFREQFLQASKNVLPSIKENDEMKQLKKEGEALEEKIHSILFEEKDFIDFTNKNKQPIHTLIDVCTYFLKTYNTLKEEENGIDFSDMEHFALAILQAENGLIASIYREQFIEIMVDEFQDSNDVQDTLVKLICRSNNVFRVGDIKQSIYGFRHATPDIMRSLISNKTENDEVIYLNNNYRSKKTIVDFNNQLFDTMMNVDGFQSSFQENDFTNCGLDSQSIDCNPIQFHLINDTAINEVQPYPKTKDELKASYIANKIVSMVEQGYQYRDFVVLIKTNAKSEPLRDAFENCHIPYFINMKYGFFDSSAVMNTITFLKALKNPHDDLNFVGLLLSPFFQIKDEQIAQAKLSKANASFYEYFKEATFLTSFNELLKTKNKTKLSDLVHLIFMTHEYYEKYTTLQEQSNLDKLFEMILDHESQSFMTLEQFLLIIEQSKDTKIGEAIPIGNEDDVVRVMSIHQSKGLQFPVVFLYSTNSINLMDTRGLISFDDQLKIGMNYLELPHRYVYPTLERIALNHKMTKAAIEEEIRVLYVATTRAQNEMYVIDCGKQEQRNPIDKLELYKKKGFSSWILQSFHQQLGSLYNEEYIDSLWEDKTMDTIATNVTSLPRYSYSYEENTILSPSENEVISYRPNAFSMDEDYAMERGTILHKMVEVLPSIIWTKELIHEYANSYFLSLNEEDYDILISLSNHPIFKSLQSGKVFHEYPFMTKNNNIITHGFMDFVALFEKEVYLVDFKSDRHVDPATLITRYKSQIKAYHEALDLLYPEHTITSYIYSFELNEMIPIL